MNFFTGSSDGRSKIRDRLEVDHCWPDDIIGIPNADQNAERARQKREQKQRYMDYSLRGFKPNYLQLKAREQLMECMNATWNNFSTHNIQRDVMLQVCSNFLYDVEQIKIELTTMRQEMRNLRRELQEHRVNCMEKKLDHGLPPKRGNQKTVRFCNYCHKNGHTPNLSRKMMRDEETRKLQHDVSLNKNVAPIRVYGTSDSNCRSQHDESKNRCPDSDDVNTPLNKILTTEDGTCKDESNDVTPLEPKFISTTKGMSFNMAKFTGESDNEQSNALPLRY